MSGMDTPASVTRSAARDVARAQAMLLCEPGLSKAKTRTMFAELAAMIDGLADWLAEDPQEFSRVFTQVELLDGLALRTRRLLRTVREVRDANEAVDAILRPITLSDLESRLTRSLFRALSDTLRDYNLPMDLVRSLRIPIGYKIDTTGVRRVRQEDQVQLVCQRPLFIFGRTLDMATGMTRMLVGWPAINNTRWIVRLVPRAMLMDARKIVDLAEMEAPVTSSNRLALVDYLGHFEAANPFMPVVSVSTRLGWLPLGESAEAPEAAWGFVFPDTFYGPKGPSVVFRPVDNAADEWAGVKTGGSWAGWLEAAHMALAYPHAMLAVYAAAAAPLIAILKTKNFILDFHAEPGSGKTTILKLAASVTGNPEEKGAGLTFTWNASPAWVTRVAGIGRNFAFIMDDTREARQDDVVAMLYTFAKGRGRGRADIRGVQDTDRWETLMISCGESPVAERAHVAGAIQRVLTVEGRPMGRPSEFNRAIADRIQATIEQHHGWLIRKMVDYLVQRQGSWSELREAHANIVEGMAATGITDTGMGARQAHYIATLQIAAAICHDIGLPRPAPENDPFALAIRAAQHNVRLDVADEALAWAVSWIAANAQQFLGRQSARGLQSTPRAGWLGVWSGSADWSWVAVRESVLRTHLLTNGYDPADVLRRWTERGVLIGAGRAQIHQGVRVTMIAIEGVQVRCCCIPRAVFDGEFAPTTDALED